MCPIKIISRLDSESKSNETLREEQEVRADVAFNTLEANSLKTLMLHSIVKNTVFFLCQVEMISLREQMELMVGRVDDIHEKM